MTATSWQPIATAPRDRLIEIRAERWIASTERMRVETFAGCKWCEGGSVRHPAPYWRRLPRGWVPTHWREAPSATSAKLATGETPWHA
ncbi:hypothetical protein [Methylobacterium durans]|uniref:hypothetical protein n=1 Tax=Methylobacterium durans TaxID=2202825 RepID=UPI0013A577B4|nr:hypothetical protein [Methylobacterium durans]